MNFYESDPDRVICPTELRTVVDAAFTAIPTEHWSLADAVFTALVFSEGIDQPVYKYRLAIHELIEACEYLADGLLKRQRPRAVNPLSRG